MRPMNWDYLAALLDGEGTLGAHRSKNRVAQYVVGIYQSGDDGLELLRECQNFLQSYGIRAYLYSATDKEMASGHIPSKRRMNKLVVNRAHRVQRFLSLVLPYLRMKRQKAEDLIRFLKIYPPIRGKYQSSLLRSMSEEAKTRRRNSTIAANRRRALPVNREALLADRILGLSYSQISEKHSVSRMVAWRAVHRT